MTAITNPFGDQTYNKGKNDESYIKNYQIGNQSSVVFGHDPKEMVNATNDLNPLIMLSGDDGSASRSGYTQAYDGHQNHDFSGITGFGENQELY